MTRVAACLLLTLGAASAQRLSYLETPRPLPAGDTLIIGFMPGIDSYDDDRRAVRKVALRLRARGGQGLHIETFANRRRHVALRLVREAVGANRHSARVILYGYSLGGSAVIRLARELERLHIPVLLTIQVDSVGVRDGVVPANVRRAANLYQGDGWPVHGVRSIRPADPGATTIIANRRVSYHDREIELPPTEYTFWQRNFAIAHSKMDADPQVWAQVERWILDAAQSP